MSISTSIQFLNFKDPEFLEAKNGTSEQLEEWEDDNGSIADRPGAVIECEEHHFYEETNDEYGGWLIDVSKLPEGTTHICVSRG